MILQKLHTSTPGASHQHRTHFSASVAAITLLQVVQHAVYLIREVRIIGVQIGSCRL